MPGLAIQSQPCRTVHVAFSYSDAQIPMALIDYPRRCAPQIRTSVGTLTRVIVDDEHVGEGGSSDDGAQAARARAHYALLFTLHHGLD